ncbi:MAG: 3-deoxy-manno-octulosonate cytidylyltransferase [bacterium]
MKRIVAIIPSRLESSRISQKPLVDILGTPMIAHVYHRARLSPILEDVLVATDSEVVKRVVENHGGKAVITSDSHTNGTERLAEAVRGLDAEYVVLVNGDEALLNPQYIETSYRALLNSDAQASILVNPFHKTNSPSDFKVVLNLNNEVMYISRGDIPCDARNPVEQRLKAYHIMTFRREFLSIYAGLRKTPMESVEDHEHLRIIENGYKIIACQVESTAVSVDTEDDLKFVRENMLRDPFYQRYKDLVIDTGSKIT